MCLMLICMNMFAGNPFKIIVGKENAKSVMRQPAIAIVDFDWSSTMYDFKITAKEKFGNDYDFIVNHCQNSFITAFNGASKGLRVTTDSSVEAQYKVVLKVTNLDSYMQVMGFAPRPEGKVWGKFIVSSVATGEKVLEVKIDEAEDGTDFVWRECFGKTFAEMGKNLTKKIK